MDGNTQERKAQLGVTGPVSSRKSLVLIFVLAVLVGTFWFRVIDRAAFNPGRTAWIFTVKDMAQHYLGWEFFRNEAWTFPLGKIQNYGYPFGTSLNFTDSIPLAAFFFKLLNPILPQDFQYFGIWLWVGFILQTYFALLILRKATSSLTAMVLGASLVVLSPNLLFRLDVHTSLTSHWLILGGVYLGFEARRSPVRHTWQWPVLFGCASLVHLYFIPILFALYCIDLLLARINGRSYRQLFTELGINLLVMLAVNGLAGNYNLNGSDLNIGGFGYYSMNLDALFDPNSYSAFLRNLPNATPGQTEGFNYLGLGNLILLAWCILLLAQNLPQIHLRKQDYAILIGCGILTLIALSNRITILDHTVLVIPFPRFIQAAAGIFRSTGRFFWPVFYVLVTSMLIFFLSRTRAKTAIILLILVVLVQWIDLTPMIRYIQTTTAFTWKTPLQNEFWKQVPNYFDSLILYPAEYNVLIDRYEPVAHMAATNHFRMNAGYIARWPEKRTLDYAESEFDQALSGQIDPGQLFIILNQQAVKRVHTDKLVVISLDGYTLMFSKDNSLLESWMNWKKYEIPVAP